MLDVCLLGTGGMIPEPNRKLSSLMIRYKGINFIIDCGEGTQLAIKEKKWSFKQINIICFTHYHADHVGGLPGLLLAIGNSGKRNTIILIGPKNLIKIVKALCIIAQEIPFNIKFIELTKIKECFEFCDYKITAFLVKHNILCYGYSIEIKRNGKFNVINAKKMKIPIKYWNLLQKGKIIKDNNNIYVPNMVIGKPRKGIKLTYSTDTRPTKSIIKNAKYSDLFICEGMYCNKKEKEKAQNNKHMTFNEAAYIAKKACVKTLWLTHYSPSLIYPNESIFKIKKIFYNTIAANDKESIKLKFK